MENDHGGTDRLYRRIRVELRGRRHGDERVLADPHCDLIHYHAKQNDRRLGNDGHKGVNMENAKVDSKRRKNSFISLQHLVKVYRGGEKAVFDFDLDIERNEFIVIVGPSGCGKSTTLRMIAGLEDISDGDIYLEDELLNFKPCKDRRMAIVFQSYALYPQMNVYNNIAFPLTINMYPMPKVNAWLKANAEIENLLQNVPWDKFIGVLYNVSRGKGRANNPHTIPHKSRIT